MLPEHRFPALLEGLKRSQVERCLYHTTDDPPSLCVDHMCDRSKFPSEVLVELSALGLESSKKPDEVWQVRFSPDGRRLASCGTDEAVSIWDVGSLTRLHRLQGHGKHGIGNLSWAPDSRLLVSCGCDSVAKLWDTDVSDKPRVEGCHTPGELTSGVAEGRVLARAQHV